MGRNGIEPPTYGFSDRRSTTELPKNSIMVNGRIERKRIS